MNILLLGGNGFMGRSLTKELLKFHEHRISVFDKLNPQQKLNGVNYFTGEFSDEQVLSSALKSCDLVIHFLSSSAPRTSNESISEDIRVNIIGTVRLLELMVAEKVPAILFISSGGAVYGNPSALPVKEDAPTFPVSFYGIMKLSIEKYMHYFSVHHGIRSLIFRVSTLYGPDFNRIDVQGLVSTILYKIKNKQQVSILGDGSSVRDYIFIDDLLALLLRAIERPGSQGVYNVGSGIGISINELIRKVEDTIGEKALINYTPQNPNDVNRIVLNIDKVKKEFDWSPRVSMENGILKCWEDLDRTNFEA